MKTFIRFVYYKIARKLKPAKDDYNGTIASGQSFGAEKK